MKTCLGGPSQGMGALSKWYLVSMSHTRFNRIRPLFECKVVSRAVQELRAGTEGGDRGSPQEKGMCRDSRLKIPSSPKKVCHQLLDVHGARRHQLLDVAQTEQVSGERQKEKQEMGKVHQIRSQRMFLKHYTRNVWKSWRER